MQQALSNLLSNAVQHGDRRSPVVLSAAGEPDAVVLKVSNAGDPIPADALQVIFEPLVQAPSASSQAHERSKTSLGLGPVHRARDRAGPWWHDHGAVLAEAGTCSRFACRAGRLRPCTAA